MSPAGAAPAPRQTVRRAPRTVRGLSALLLAYLAVPVAVFLGRAAGHPAAGFAIPGLFPALRISAESATISTCLVGVLGVPLGYWLAHSASRWAAVAGALVQLPLALPPLVAGVVLLYVFGDNTVIGRLAGGHLTESVVAIVLAQSFVSAPFLVIAARSAFERVPPALEEVAATAGLGPVARVWRVALPVAAPGVRAGLVLAWLRAFGEYGATVMMAYYPMSLPVFTYVQFSAIGLPATQAASLLSLALATAVVFVGRASLPAAWARARPRGPVMARPPGGPGRPPASTATVRGGAPTTPVAFELSHRAGEFCLRASYRATSHRLAIVGPSGAGKSITLRCLAGLLPGQVSFGGLPVGGLPAERRRVGYVPQGDSLMPHLSLWDNVTFGPYAEAGLAAYWLGALGLADLGGRRPAQLSGGQRQRGALVRALAGQPRLLLLDEPFTGLDAPQRAGLLREMRRLQQSAGLSTVMVTHDGAEAALLADEVVVMSGGLVAQAGPMPEVISRPATAEVAGVLGWRNLLPGVAATPRSLRAGPGEAGPEVMVAEHGLTPGTALTWSVSPRRVKVSTVPTGAAVPAAPVDVAAMGVYDLAQFDIGAGVTVEVETEPGLIRAGRESPGHYWLSVPAEAVSVWAAPRA